MKRFFHTLHKCGHAAFWNNPDVAADMHLRELCPWCKGVPRPSIVRDDRLRLECVANEDDGAEDEVGSTALYIHRADEGCCAVQIAATIGASRDFRNERSEE